MSEHKDHTVGPLGAGPVAPRADIHGYEDSLSQESLARRRATAEELIEACHRFSSTERHPGMDAAFRMVLGRLAAFSDRQEHMVELAERRYRRIERFLSSANPTAEQALVWANRLDDAWLTWKTAWDLHHDISQALQKQTSVPQPPSKPDI